MLNKIKQLLDDGSECLHRGKLEESVYLLEEALAAAQTDECDSLKAEAYFKLGSALFHRRDFLFARKNWENAKKLFTKLENEDRRADTAYNLGNLFMNQGKYSESVEFFQEAFYIYLKNEDLKNQGDSGFNLGTAAMELGRFDIARNAFLSAREAYLKLGDRENLADTIYQIAGMFFKGSDLSAALENYEKAESVYKELDDFVQVADCRSQMGRILVKMSKYGEARDVLASALNQLGGYLVQTAPPATLSLLEVSHEALENFYAGVKDFLEALDLSESNREDVNSAHLLSKLGEMEVKKGNYLEALKQYTKSLTLYRKFEERENEGDLYYNIGGVYEHLEDRENARHFYKQAMIAYEKCHNSEKAILSRQKVSDLI